MLTTAEELNLRFIGDGIVYAPQRKCPHAPQGTPPKLRIDKNRAARKAAARARMRKAVIAEQRAAADKIVERINRVCDLTGEPHLDPAVFDYRFGSLAPANGGKPDRASRTFARPSGAPAAAGGGTAREDT